MYQVSNKGEIRSVKRKLPDGRLRKGTTLKPYKDKDGYKHVRLSKNGRMKNFSVHRLVAETFVDNPSGLPQVNHIDETRDNNKADNLEWCDARYNLMYGTHQQKITEKISGEHHYCHKLTNDIVKEIRTKYIPGDGNYGQSALARKYDVSQSAIRSALLKRTWKCVKED